MLISEREMRSTALAQSVGGQKKRRDWTGKKEKKRKERGGACQGVCVWAGPIGARKKMKEERERERESWFGQAYKPGCAGTSA